VKEVSKAASWSAAHQILDDVLVEIAAADDPGVGEARFIQQGPGPAAEVG